MEHDLWKIVMRKKCKNTNCAMPQYILNNALSSTQIKLPLLFKVTNTHNNRSAICVADDFTETDRDHREAHVSPIVIDYLDLDLKGSQATIDLINQTPSAIPPKGKLVVLEPQSHLFYKIKDPQNTLEKCLQNSYIVGVGYLIPITLKVSNKKIIIQMKITKILDLSDHEVPFANINHVDLNVDFDPLPEHLRPKPKKKPIDLARNVRKEVAPLPQVEIPPMKETESLQPAYDPAKRWTPFCGWGRTLLEGKYVAGAPQK